VYAKKGGPKREKKPGEGHYQKPYKKDK